MIKTEVISNHAGQGPTTKANRYPYIGITDDGKSIVLFTAKDTGLALVSPVYSVCATGTNFKEEYFNVFDGSVVISQ